MVEGHSRTDMTRRLNSRASAAKTGTDALPTGHRQESRQHLAFGRPGRHRIGRRDGTGRNVKLGGVTSRDGSKPNGSTECHPEEN